MRSFCNSIFVLPEESQSLPKLRLFIELIQEDQFSLVLLSKLAEDYKNMKILIRPELYQEFLSIVDCINPKYCAENEYFIIIDMLCSFGIEHSLLNTVQTILESSFNKMKSSPKKFKQNLSLNLMLGLIFKGLKHSPYNFSLILLNFLQKGNYMGNTRTEKKYCTEDFTIISIFTSLCEVYYETSKYIDWFIENTDLKKRVILLIDTFLEQDLKKMLEDKERILTTSACRKSYNLDSEYNITRYSANESLISRRSMSGDGTSLREYLKKVVLSFEKWADVETEE